MVPVLTCFPQIPEHLPHNFDVRFTYPAIVRIGSPKFFQDHISAFVLHAALAPSP